MLDLDTFSPDVLERFVSTCLSEGQVWECPRTSDGISHIDRVVERVPERLGICGRIWSIEQTRHIFWLEVWRSGDDAAWFLYFDVIETTERRAALRALVRTPTRHRVARGALR